MLDLDIQYLKGVGPSRAAKLNKLNIFTVEDLLNYLPVKYEDRRTVKFINELCDNLKCLLKVKIFEKPKKARLKKNMSIIKATGKDETGFITLTFFNQDFLMDKLIEGEMYYVYGVVKADYGKFEMTNPEIELCENDWKANKITPVYGLTYGLTNNELTKLIKTALENYYDKIDNVLPEAINSTYNLISRKNAIKNLHFPENGKKYSLSKKTIAYEKLLIMQLGLMAIKSNLRSVLPGNVIKNYNLANKLVNSIPYELTNAQLRVINEIKNDMSLTKPMNRLVQGDVGSGKTVVAIYALLAAVDSGYQASMMAPTEILAMQHYETIMEYLSLADISVNVAFLSGSTKQKQKKEILQKLKAGEIDILVGTHALIEDNVEFNNIGLVITDEQHRFGVRQRGKLSNKGNNPDILIMTATPIPRTLALMIYGDLDISIIDEMPPGRQIIITSIVKGSNKEEAYEFIKKQINEGRQAYIVAPLVESSEKLELDSATEIFEELENSFFSDYKLGLLHGKMNNAEKELVINKFYEGKINVLVSTTVIEVGVNVPNSTIMLVLNAERFGLAQLHQLRGRVGRGKYQSYCILVNESKKKVAAERMKILKSTNDGFIIAEEDLKLRGPGDFFGTQQSGISKYDIQNIVNDVEIVQNVQQLSKKILKENPKLLGEEYKNLKNSILNLFKDETIVFNWEVFMRIISGTNKGMKLYAPEGMSVRPTSDKIKEAIFNMLGYIDEESVVLDLFAGAGGVGIEFIARGARLCYFVDASHKSLSFVKKNLELCKFKEKSKVIMSDYEKAIENFSKDNLKFDFIFADPPYALNCGSNIASKVFEKNLLKPDGTLIIETDKDEKVIEGIQAENIKYKEKIYGRTRISIMKYSED